MQRFMSGAWGSMAMPLLAAFSAALFCASSADAMGVSGEVVPRVTHLATLATPTPATAAASTELRLVNGTVSAVDTTRHTLTLAGHAVPWDPAQVKVYTASGTATTIDQVRAGMRIRFALQPGSGVNRKIVRVQLRSGA